MLVPESRKLSFQNIFTLGCTFGLHRNTNLQGGSVHCCWDDIPNCKQESLSHYVHSPKELKKKSHVAVHMNVILTEDEYFQIHWWIYAHKEDSPLRPSNSFAEQALSSGNFPRLLPISHHFPIDSVGPLLLVGPFLKLFLWKAIWSCF